MTMTLHMTHERTHSFRRAVAAAAVTIVATALAACDRGPGAGHTDAEGGATATATTPAAASAPAAPTNRVDIPEAVRRNLGIVFAKVESRAVERTLRIPGRFELLPTSRREYRSPVEGTVEVLVAQHQAVEAGTPLFRVRSPELSHLAEEIASAKARLASFVPVRRAQEANRASLQDQARLWEERIASLERIREAGGGGAAQIASARAEFGSVQVALAEVAAKEAELESARLIAESALRALESQRELLHAAAGCSSAADLENGRLVVCSSAAGQVDQVPATQGGRIEESSLVVSVIDPAALRFRARALQADLTRLREGIGVRIVPAPGSGDAGAAAGDQSIPGTAMIAPTADPAERTIEVLVTPQARAVWARAGIAGSLEVPLEGATDELAIPLAAVVRDGLTPVIFRRDPANPDRAIRMEADLGASDGRWIAILSGVREGDEVVVAGNHQLMLATSGSAPKGGHFHPDGTFHEGEN